MDVKNKQKSQDDFKTKEFYEVVSRILAFVDKVDKNKKKKGDLKW